MESTLLLIYVVFISYCNLFFKGFFIAIVFPTNGTPLGLLDLIISNKSFFLSKILKDFLVLFCF